MVKWKKMNKKMAGLLLGVMMLFTASTTAFAYVDESAEASKTEVTQTEQTVSQEEAPIKITSFLPNFLCILCDLSQIIKTFTFRKFYHKQFSNHIRGSRKMHHRIV